jgi:uncharacterized membrane protein
MSLQGYGAGAVEALCNAVVGFAVSWVITVFVLGYTASGGLAVTGMFFVASFVRSWAIREGFRKWG